MTPEQLKAAEDARDAALAELELLKREKMSEQERAIQEAKDAMRAELEPKVGSLTKTVQAYLDAEVAEIPEDKRDLIPDLPLEQQLTWIKNAKSKGLFAPPPSSSSGITPGTTPSGGKAKADLQPGTPEYAEYLAKQYGIQKSSSSW